MLTTTFVPNECNLHLNRRQQSPNTVQTPSQLAVAPFLTSEPPCTVSGLYREPRSETIRQIVAPRRLSSEATFIPPDKRKASFSTLEAQRPHRPLGCSLTPANNAIREVGVDKRPRLILRETLTQTTPSDACVFIPSEYLRVAMLRR